MESKHTFFTPVNTNSPFRTIASMAFNLGSAVFSSALAFIEEQLSYIAHEDMVANGHIHADPAAVVESLRASIPDYVDLSVVDTSPTPAA